MATSGRFLPPKGLTPAQIALWEDATRKMMQAAEWNDDLEKLLDR
jgi:tripartite-type tricarboxylate transporter receptor subunit TctC